MKNFLIFCNHVFKENVRFLPRVNTSPAWSDQGSESGGDWPYSYVYGSQSNNYQNAVAEMSANNMGALFNQNAIIFWNLCPSGWHVSSDNDWLALESFLGMDSLQLEATGWRGGEDELGLQLRSVEWGGYDTFGFNIVASGIREEPDFKHGPSTNEPYAVFLTSSWSDGSLGSPIGRTFGGENSGIARGPLSRNGGYSVRCIKDAE